MSIPPAFVGSGELKGQNELVEMWRIEAMEPAKWTQLGKLYDGDCYITLHSKMRGSAVEQHIYFWLGGECSQDERGAAALHTINLDDMHGGAPIQHREVQGNESPEFMALFRKLCGGITILSGGIESGFNHVEPASYVAKLLHIKGKRSTRSTEVKCTAASVNDDDVFVLDKGLKVIVWNGATANAYEKAAAAKVARGIKDERTEVNVAIEVVESADPAPEFWEALGGKPATIAPGSGSDDDVKAAPRVPPCLFKVSDAGGSMSFAKVGEGKLERSMLDTNDCFILDDGKSQVFSWVGKKANPAERKQAMQFAEQYMSEAKLDAVRRITRVPESGETNGFKACFVQWAPPQVKAPAGEYKQEEIDPAALAASIAQRKTAEENKLVDDGSGQLEIWRIEDFDMKSIPTQQYGQFFRGDSYIVLYTYKQGTRDCYIIYYWQGRQSTSDEKGASALKAVELDETRCAGDAVQVRVAEGREPDHFISLFKNRMVVHAGGRASAFKNRNDEDTYDTDGISLFHVRGTNERNTYAAQVDEKAASLNSGDCFVLLTPDTMYNWQGGGSNADEQKTASNVAAVLKGSRAVQDVPEGSEPAPFWEALGGQGEYPRVSTVGGVPYEPRLFAVTSAGAGRMNVEEIISFAQADLLPDDVMILDAGDEVFVWVGSGSTREEKSSGITVADSYIKSRPSGNADTPIFKIKQGCEPPNFTCHFGGWDSTGMASEAEIKAATQQVTAADAGFAKTANEPGGVTLALSALQDKAALPENIDHSRRELYLSDAEFQATFGMDKAAFAGLAKWKKQQQKKKVGLF